MIELAAKAVPPTLWWETTLATIPGQLLVAALAFTGVILTLRHTRSLQDTKAEAEDRSKRVDTDNAAIAKLITTLHPWLSAFASWGATYERAGATALSSPAVHDLHKTYTAAALELNEALSVARVTVRNPAARPALDVLREQRARVTGLATVGMLGQPDPKFTQYWQEIHVACAKALDDLEEAAVNWDGTVADPITVETPTLDATTAQDKGNSIESET